MKTGQLKIDILTLNETNIVQEATSGTTGVRTLRLIGIETKCDIEHVEVMRDNILSLNGRPVPVQFEYKASLNGYYRVTDVSVDTDKWYNGATAIGWSLNLERIGPDNAVDVESRLANIVRQNDFSLAGERWHAPAIGHYSYFVGAVGNTTVTRASEDGNIIVYRGIPAGVNPRWGSPVSSFVSGRVKFIANGVEIVGPRQLLSTTGWEINNGLVRVRPEASNASLLIAFYTGTTWQEQAYDIRLDGATMTPSARWRAVNVSRRDHEATSVRIVAEESTGQRALIDLILRRGSRFVEGYVQQATSGTIAVALDLGNPVTAATGYAITNDIIGSNFRVAIGSARTFTTIAGGIQKSSTTVMDFWVGAITQSDVSPTLETGAESGTTTGWSAAAATLTSTTEQAKFGSRSYKITANNAAGFPSMSQVTPSDVVAGQQYTIYGWLYTPSTLPANAFIDIVWRNASNSVVSENITSVALTPGTWTYVEATHTAPATTVRATRLAGIQLNPTPAGTVMYVDELHIIPASGGSSDTGNALRDQYVGAMAESTEVVRR